RPPEGRPGRCRDPRVQEPRAVQGQGRALLGRDGRDQRNEEEVRREARAMDKKISRRRRAAKTRVRIGRQNAVRLAVHRTNLHIYAQVIDAAGEKILASASTLEKDVRASHPNGAKKEAAAEVGKRIAEKAKAAGVTEV